jgi:hypothetical protein
MAWRFRKRIKIIPGVHINLNSKVISTTIGPKGASMTFGKSGTYLNTSIPQLGISNRQNVWLIVVTFASSTSATIPSRYGSEQ